MALKKASKGNEMKLGIIFERDDMLTFPIHCCVFLSLSLVVISCSCGAFGAETYIVRDGRPMAEIVTSKAPLPMVSLAANELRKYIEKISGAKLIIKNEATQDETVKIYVGKSDYTDGLGITDEGLDHGAFKIISGKNHLILFGKDNVFNRSKLLDLARFKEGTPEKKRMWDEWYEKSGGNWGLPYSQYYKDFNDKLNISAYDDRGSLNAVYEFIRMLGARWYMPGEIGEVVLERKDIILPEINKTVIPDFELRHPYQYGKRFSCRNTEEILWQLRMGFCNAPDIFDVGYIAHGLNYVTGMHDLAFHPGATPKPAEYFSLRHGKRDVSDKKHNGEQCLSYEPLIEENVEYARAICDVFNAPMVSVMPADGYTTLCECDFCKGKATPERGWNGMLSDYVWGYANRVAEEVFKTHPDKKIVSMAYTTYQLPPEKLKRFSPNMVVCIAQGRCNFTQNPDSWEKFVLYRKGFLSKFPADMKGKKLCQYEYYRYAVPGKPYAHLPAFFPRAISKDLKALKGISYGDYIEVYRGGSIGVTHLNLYVTGRCWWNADLDVEELLDEYYVNFYGPAHEEMKAFIEFSENNWMAMSNDARKIEQAFSYLNKATKKVAQDSLYAKRIKLIEEYIYPMREILRRLSSGREDAPEIGLIKRARKDIIVDGKDDERVWRLPGYAGAAFREAETGGKPTYPTKFKVAWTGTSILFAIRCGEPDMANLNIGSNKNDDVAIRNGDCIDILIETQGHSYYALSVSPSGAILDLDRKNGRDETRWFSNADVKIYKAKDYWTAVVEIPAAGSMQEDLDALNGLSGRMPSKTYPWFFNIYRQRIRGDRKEVSAFSPPGKPGIHHPDAFGRINTRR